MIPSLKKSEVWLVTGSQRLYGPETLKQVAENSMAIARALDQSSRIPCQVVFKPVVKTSEEIHGLLTEANSARDCVGLVFWMHTFSPAKMWIAGLTALQKPYAHLHTQFNRDLPWGSIDMDFMNLNQAAHGDREFGFICTRLRQSRMVVVGHWQDEEVHDRLAIWMRAACAWADSRRLKLARFGDNMREVAVTEGDKVAAQRQFGYSVNGFGVGDMVAKIACATDAEVDRLVKEYSELYEVRVSPEQLGPCGDRPVSRSACAPSWRRGDSPRSRIPSRISTASSSFPAWRCSASWRKATASGPKATGRRRHSSGPSR